MNLKQAAKAVQHECRPREFLKVAERLGLSEPWTDEDVIAVRAARHLIPSNAAKIAGLRVGPFVEKATELDLEPPWTMDKVMRVRDRATPPFPGLTSEQVAAELKVSVDAIRRTSREFEIGEKVDGGCYMVDGVRDRRPRESRSFTDADVLELTQKLPDEAHTYPIRVSKDVYHAARRQAKASDDPATGPSDVLDGWLEEGMERAVKVALPMGICECGADRAADNGRCTDGCDDD